MAAPAERPPLTMSKSEAGQLTANAKARPHHCAYESIDHAFKANLARLTCGLRGKSQMTIVAIGRPDSTGVAE